MQIVIEIPDKIWESVQDGTYCGTLYKELKNGTPLPKGRKPMWIPVSERLPENYRRVLVSDVMGIYIGEFVDAEENWGGKHFINEHGMHSKSVKAWMPLPEPYKAESEG